MNLPFDANSPEDPFEEPLPEFCPEPADPAPSEQKPVKQRLIEEIAEEVSRQLTEMRRMKGKEQALITHRVGMIALECARALDEVEARLLQVDEEAAPLSARLQDLRDRVYQEMASSLQQARDEHDGIYRLPLN